MLCVHCCLMLDVFTAKCIEMNVLTRLENFFQTTLLISLLMLKCMLYVCYDYCNVNLNHINRRCCHISNRFFNQFSCVRGKCSKIGLVYAKGFAMHCIGRPGERGCLRSWRQLKRHSFVTDYIEMALFPGSQRSQPSTPSVYLSIYAIMILQFFQAKRGPSAVQRYIRHAERHFRLWDDSERFDSSTMNSYC